MLLSNWNKTVCFHELAKILHRTDNANTWLSTTSRLLAHDIKKTDFMLYIAEAKNAWMGDTGDH